VIGPLRSKARDLRTTCGASVEQFSDYRTKDAFAICMSLVAAPDAVQGSRSQYWSKGRLISKTESNKLSDPRHLLRSSLIEDRHSHPLL
jgi:hypothetical protein